MCLFARVVLWSQDDDKGMLNKCRVKLHDQETVCRHQTPVHEGMLPATNSACWPIKQDLGDRLTEAPWSEMFQTVESCDVPRDDVVHRSCWPGHNRDRLGAKGFVFFAAATLGLEENCPNSGCDASVPLLAEHFLHSNFGR